MNRLLPLVLLSVLAACGANSRYLIAPVEPAQKQRVSVGSVEVREVSLPAYAAASEIVVEQADGSLLPVKKAIWADDPPRGVTGALARSLDARSTASVAAEPWPLAEPAQVQVEVRVDRMIARLDGTFQLTGQFAVAAPSGSIRERVERFDITTPLADTTPAAVAAATGAAIDALSVKIVARLR